MYQGTGLEGSVVTSRSGWPFPAHCTYGETEAGSELRRLTLMAAKQASTLGRWVYCPHVPSEPGPAGLGTVLSCSKQAWAPGRQEEAKVCSITQGIWGRGTSQQ